MSQKTRGIIESYVHERGAKLPVRIDSLPNEMFEVNTELVDIVLEESNNSFLATLWPNLPGSISKCFSALYIHLKGSLRSKLRTSYGPIYPC